MFPGELAKLVEVLTNQVSVERSERQIMEATVRAEVAKREEEVVKREAVEASLAALIAQVAELTAYHRQVQVRVMMMMLLVHVNYYCCYNYSLEIPDVMTIIATATKSTYK